MQETTLALTQHENLLGVLLGTLLQVLRRGLDADGHMDGDSPELSGEWPGLALMLACPAGQGKPAAPPTRCTWLAKCRLQSLAAFICI
jgi:hypothetical protein